MISEAESDIMRVLWDQSPLPTEEILARLPHKEWQLGTVKALLNRLLSKAAVAAEKDGRRFLYSPLLRKEQYLAHASKNFLERVFEGEIAPIVAHFSKYRALNQKDRAALKKLLEELGDD
jgi:BlaI family transcriptional regulator, penicillinase repressor